VAPSNSLGSFKNAATYGIGSYRDLRREVKGSGLNVHHLIEQRFADVMEQNPNDMLSIVLTPEEHQEFTNAWRAEIGYGTGVGQTGTATQERVIEAARNIYRNYPDILKALGL